MLVEENFQHLYLVVRPTVRRLQRLYRIKLWSAEDWEQEGMMVLFDLLSHYPELTEQEAQLRVYFKTKFSNHINDELRKQDSLKRQFNRMAYEEISDISHTVPSRGLQLDDLVAFKDSWTQALTQLSPQELLLVDDLLTGKAFKGRTQLIRKLKKLMGE